MNEGLRSGFTWGTALWVCYVQGLQMPTTDPEKPVENLVKRGKGLIFAEVIENVEKINFKKCPIHPMRCDIMVL
ncbi:MAG: hypothetical protein ABSB39_02890 [Candidatus Sulfotelmatobacter sp.]|jgi:hypothetical protein